MTLSPEATNEQQAERDPHDDHALNVWADDGGNNHHEADEDDRRAREIKFN